MTDPVREPAPDGGAVRRSTRLATDPRPVGRDPVDELLSGPVAGPGAPYGKPYGQPVAHPDDGRDQPFASPTDPAGFPSPTDPARFATAALVDPGRYGPPPVHPATSMFPPLSTQSIPGPWPIGTVPIGVAAMNDRAAPVAGVFARADGIVPPNAVTLDRQGQPIPKMTRSRDGRIVGGVAAGIADHLRVPVIWVRVVFCLLGLLTGVGVVAYALFWIFVPQAENRSAASPVPPTSRDRRQAVGVTVLGAALAVIGTTFGLGQSAGWIIGPLGLAAIGGAFIWREADDAQRQRWRRSAAGVVGEGSSGLWRVAGGIALVVGGLAVFALGQFDFSAAGSALLAVVLTLIGVAIIGIPWWVKLVRDLGTERRQLVAQQERAEIAAHLHDSVLQTLALIQRQAGDPREVQRLSRSQERELRAWLYGPTGYAVNPLDPTAAAEQAAGETMAFSAALTLAAGEVEDTYAVKVTPVVVGDTPMDAGLAALVAASREAMVNAAKHAGVPDISVYAEIEDGTATVFVRDRGVGFDQDQVGADRRGLAESIRGRMDRHHGRATVRSTLGDGTEVELSMPISADEQVGPTPQDVR